MNWLSTWIIGHDTPIHPLRFAEMIAKFEASGRQVKTAITDLLLSPEFRGIPAAYPEAASYQKAKAVLENCEDCHNPWLQSRGEQLKINISKIIGRLDLAHDGLHRTMPPSSHFWEPTKHDLLTLKNWILEGAPISPDAALLTPAEVQRGLGQPTERGAK